jgi:carbon storage regulator CsrA
MSDNSQKVEQGCLVLTRKKNESLTIGDSIEIKVIQTASGSCRLLIRAPKDTKVLRSELPPHTVFPQSTQEIC